MVKWWLTQWLFDHFIFWNNLRSSHFDYTDLICFAYLIISICSLSIGYYCRLLLAYIKRAIKGTLLKVFLFFKRATLQCTNMCNLSVILKGCLGLNLIGSSQPNWSFVLNCGGDFFSIQTAVNRSKTDSLHFVGGWMSVFIDLMDPTKR